MKKILLTLIAVLTMAGQASAMSYEQARREALFLTDKMAYELNLSDAQYEAAYEINLDYLMGVTGRADVFGTYWERRNADLNFVLYTWQWDLFCAASYFYRPLYWDAGYWHFGVYARYPHREYFYFGCPGFYASYRGGHCWHRNGGRSFYERHHDYYRPHVQRTHHFGMRDGWNRGDYRNSGHGHSSTRVTGSGNSHHNGGASQDNGSGRRSGNGFTLGNSRHSERSSGSVSRNDASAERGGGTGRTSSGLGNSRLTNRSVSSTQLSRSLGNSSVSRERSTTQSRSNSSSASRSNRSYSRSDGFTPSRVTSSSSASRMNRSSATRMGSSTSQMSSSSPVRSSGSSMSRSSSGMRSSSGSSMSRSSSGMRSSSSGGGRSGDRR